jgi:two-component system, OmpR family, sensor histidine kinase ChvG
LWAVRRLAGSLTLKLVILVGIFALLPVVLYGEFETADEDKRDIVSDSVQRQSKLIAEALQPLLDSGRSPPLNDLNTALRKYGEGGMVLKLMFRPAEGDDSFYYVASAPVRRSEELDAEREQLARHGVLQQLSQSCAGNTALSIRQRGQAGSEEVLTAVVPIKTRWGCWALVTAHTTAQFLDTAIGRPYWQTREIQLAAYIYLALALLAVLTALSVRRSLRQFRAVAHEIRQGRSDGTRFAARNTLPELESVAADFDQLVEELHGAAHDIRQAAEDNAHSFKTPLATIQASFEVVRRAMPADQPRGQRAIELVDSAVARLRALVDAAQRLDTDTADLIEAPRRIVDLTQIVADALLHCREVMAERGIRLTRHIDDGVHVRAGSGLLETVIENVLDNAISFSPPGGTIAVSVMRQDREVALQVDDEGPGIDPQKIDHIFDRYFSLRPDHHAIACASDDRDEASHSGLGLWIVRRNVTAIGGKVVAVNRLGAGLSIRVNLPLAD